MAERKIATAEAQAAADVKAAAGELAAQIAEQVLAARVKGQKTDPLVDAPWSNWPAGFRRSRRRLRLASAAFG